MYSMGNGNYLIMERKVQKLSILLLTFFKIHEMPRAKWGIGIKYPSIVEFKVLKKEQLQKWFILN